MPRYDGRIEPGQRLTSAISARAWNRAQDAADIVLGSRYGAAGDEITTARLPSVRVRLNRLGGYYGEAIGGTGAVLSILQDQPISVSPHAANKRETIGQFSDDEKELVSFVFPPAAPIAICCENDSMIYTIAGYAITRVRVFNYNHRYARLPQSFPGETQTQAQERSGALDSCFWGPAKIVGYRSTSPVSSSWAHFSTSPGLIYPNYVMAWALVVL